jgi:hypothetical protein
VLPISLNARYSMAEGRKRGKDIVWPKGGKEEEDDGVEK